SLELWTNASCSRRIVSLHRPPPDEDGIDLGTELMDLAPGRLARDPLRLSRRRRDLAVKCHGRLEDDIGTLRPYPVTILVVQGLRLPARNAGRDSPSGSPKRGCTPAVDQWIWIALGNDYPPYP